MSLTKKRRPKKYAIKVTGRRAGEYDGGKTLLSAITRAKREFLPHLDPSEGLKIVHFSDDGRFAYVDKVLKEESY